jgi:hypothetical protein
MPKPWEKYQQGSAPEGPWVQYAAPATDPKKSSVGFKPEMAAPFEVALQVGTGALAEPVAGLAGILAAITPGGERAGNVVRNTREAMTYQPRTEFAQNMIPNAVEGVINMTPEFIRKPVRSSAQAYSQLEQWTADNYGPAAAAAVATLPTAILEAIPAGLAIKKMRGANAPAPQQYIPGSGPQRPRDVPEQVVTNDQYQGMGGDFRTANPDRIAPQVMPDQQILADAEKLGIVLNPSHYSTNRAYIDMEQALKSRPGSLLATNEQKAIIDLGNKADELIDSLGGSTDKAALDSNLVSEFSKTIEGLQSQAETLYGKVNTAIPRATRVDPSITRDFIEKQLSDMGGDESLLTGAEKDLLALTTQTFERPFPTYAALDRVRKDIGAAIGKRQGPYKDAETGQLQAIYSVLLEDQQRFAEAFGVGDVYKDASALVKQRKRLEEQSVALYGRELQGSIIPKLAQAASSLSRGDISKLTQVMDAVPQNMRQDVAATLLNDIFASGARRNAPLGQGFVNAYRGLNRNPSAKKVLFDHLPPDAQERFDMIGRVTTGLYQAKALENTSRTARDVIAAMDDGRLLSKLYGIGTRIAAAEGVSTAIGLPGAGTAGVVGSILTRTAPKASQLADELLASEQFTNAVKTYASGAGKTAQARLQNTPEYNAWLDAQNPSVKAEVATIGLIPWLAGSSQSESK